MLRLILTASLALIIAAAGIGTWCYAQFSAQIDPRISRRTTARPRPTTPVT